MSQNQNFDPIYAALATLLVNSATVVFTGNITEGNPVIANVATPTPLAPGLAAVHPLIPIGSVIQSVAGPNVTVSLAPTGAASGASVRAGYVSTDPVAARLLRHWTDVPAAGQPALFLAQGTETAERRSGQLTKWTLDCTIYVYCQAPDDRTPVAPTLNVLLGAIRGVFGPDASGIGRVQNRQTLGGLAFDVWIDGKIETDEGYLGQQGVAKVPVRIIQNGP